MFERQTTGHFITSWGFPPFGVIGGGGGEGEKDVSRVCVVGTEAQLVSVCVYVCLKEE